MSGETLREAEAVASVRETLASILAIHPLYDGCDDNNVCGCGVVEPDDVFFENDPQATLRWHALHTADTLIAAGIVSPADAWDQGWDERDADCSEPYSPRRQNPYRTVEAAS